MAFWTTQRIPLLVRDPKRTLLKLLLLAILLVPILSDFLEIPEASVDFFLQHRGVVAPIGLLTGEEAGIPLPVPGDAIIAYTGYQASKGAISYVLAFVALLAAVLVGSSILYLVAARWGQSIVLSLGKLVHFNEQRLITVEQRFKMYGPWYIIVGRHIPGMRIPITIFAGTSKVPYAVFLASTFVSVMIWIAIFLALGSHLGTKTVRLLTSVHWQRVLIPIVVVAAAIVAVRLARRRRRA
jgi:membrane protein DedA with SNARE-associated domain